MQKVIYNYIIIQGLYDFHIYYNIYYNYYFASTVTELEFQTIKQIFTVQVDQHQTTIYLRQKSQENKPIFQQAVVTVDRIKTLDKPILYYTFLYYIQRLGFIAKIIQIFNFYNIWRGTGVILQQYKLDNIQCFSIFLYL